MSFRTILMFDGANLGNTKPRFVERRDQAISDEGQQQSLQGCLAVRDVCDAKQQLENR
jgi:hypothetical protein